IRGNLSLKHPRIAEAVKKCARYFLETQKEDGKWSDPSWADLDAVSHPISFFDVLLAVGKHLVDEPTLAKVRASWRKGMDFMLVCSVLGMRAQCDRAIERGLEWILKHKCEHGWPDFPGMETNLERTCDGLDTLLKYRAYSQPVTTAIVKLWGYAA